MPTKRFLGITAGLLAALLSCTAHADGLGYTYLDLDYFHLMPDPSGPQAAHSAYAVFGSYALPANLVLTGSYLHSSYPFDKQFPQAGDQTENDAQLGVGYRVHLSDRIDLVPGLAYFSKRTDFEILSLDGKGYDLSLTPRFLVTDALELNAEVDHFRVHYSYNITQYRPDYNSIGNGVSVGAVYSFTHSFALGGDYAHSTSNGSIGKSYDLFARFYF